MLPAVKHKFNAYSAAEQSPYNVRNRGRPSSQWTRGSSGAGSGARSWFAGFGGGSSSGGGRGGSSAADASRRRRGGFGTIDDIRGPECRSCQ
ncbi:hypothetical protein KEM54_001480 [Ascosphaera aggregata]|nr:hypothetical protein KEM54_001480 [Ascosphaera aggregata]